MISTKTTEPGSLINYALLDSDFKIAASNSLKTELKYLMDMKMGENYLEFACNNIL